MKIVVIADIHGKYKMLQKIMDNVAKLQFDVLIAPGDFTDMFDTTPDFTQLEIADIVLQKLMIPGKQVFCVPGNHDPYEIIDVFEEYGINIHHRKQKIGDMTFIGFGGADTPFNTNFEPSEDEIEEAVMETLKGVKGKWVFVTHAPPKGTTLDVIEKKKHVGSQAIKKIIKKKLPTLVVTAHIHENSGSEKIEKSTVFYPGPAYDGYYGIVTIENGKVECETRKAS